MYDMCAEVEGELKGCGGGKGGRGRKYENVVRTGVG